MFVNEILNIDLSKLLKTNLSLEAHFILNCIQKDNQELLEEYVNKCGKFDKLVFNKLQENSFIEKLEENEDITFTKLRLTKKSIDYLGFDKLDHKRFFKELLETYPKSIKVLKGRRQLQQNSIGCRKLYKSIIDSEEKHKLILKCVKLYFKDLENSNNIQYAQLLHSWLYQQNYESYLEEASKLQDIPTNEDNYGII